MSLVLILQDKLQGVMLEWVRQVFENFEENNITLNTKQTLDTRFLDFR